MKIRFFLKRLKGLIISPIKVQFTVISVHVQATCLSLDSRLPWRWPRDQGRHPGTWAPRSRVAGRGLGPSFSQWPPARPTPGLRPRTSDKHANV